MSAALGALGKPGVDNGVNVSFASGRAISEASQGRTDIAITNPPTSDGKISVVINERFPTFYDNFKGHENPGEDYSKLSPEDERAAIFVHEGRHVDQFRSGMTLDSYTRNSGSYEEDARDTQRAINTAFGSKSIYDSSN